MALYRAWTNLLTDYGLYVSANQTFSDGATSAPGVPQMATPNWPPAGVDCLDMDACTKLFAQGVCQLGKIPMGVPPPSVYWQPFPSFGGTRPYQLTGIGAALGPTNGHRRGVVNPSEREISESWCA